MSSSSTSIPLSRPIDLTLSTPSASTERRFPPCSKLSKRVALVALVALSCVAAGLAAGWIGVGIALGVALVLSAAYRVRANAAPSRLAASAQNQRVRVPLAADFPQPQRVSDTEQQIRFTKEGSSALLSCPVDKGNLHSNKRFVYEKFMSGRELPIEERIVCRRIEGKLPTGESKVFPQKIGQLHVLEKRAFTYPGSPHAWTANFGDANLFFGCQGPLAAQDELQAAEHPALLHLYPYFDEESPRLDQPGSALLVQGIKRYGCIDTAKKIDRLNGTIYGNNFARATREELDSVTKAFENPTDSNLFVIVAPKIAQDLEGKPYSAADLQTLLGNAYAAFSSIVEKDAEAIIHTGNWGCGAFGNNPTVSALMQLTAARLAGVKTLVYYTMEQRRAFISAQAILDVKEAKQPDMTVAALIGELTNGTAKVHGLVYGKGNGT